jgi:hypothetical protein
MFSPGSTYSRDTTPRLQTAIAIVWGATVSRYAVSAGTIILKVSFGSNPALSRIPFKNYATARCPTGRSARKRL